MGKELVVLFFFFFQMWKFGIFDYLFQTCILKTVFKEMENNMNTFFLSTWCSWTRCSARRPTLHLLLSASFLLPRERKLQAWVNEITAVTEQRAVREQLLGQVSWGWLQDGASPCHLSRAGRWHSKRCSSFPPGWPLPPSLPYLVLHHRRSDILSAETSAEDFRWHIWGLEDQQKIGLLGSTLNLGPWLQLERTMQSSFAGGNPAARLLSSGVVASLQWGCLPPQPDSDHMGLCT